MTRWRSLGRRVAFSLVSFSVAVSCTGPRPVLVEPPSLDAATYAATLPSASATDLPPSNTEEPGEPTAQDAIFVWSQEHDLDYAGTCSSLGGSAGEQLCSRQVENFAVYELGPSVDEVWWVLDVPETTDGFRVETVVVAGPN